MKQQLFFLFFSIYFIHAQTQEIISTQSVQQEYSIQIELLKQSLKTGQSILTPFKDEAVFFTERSNFSPEFQAKFPSIKSYMSTTAPVIYLDIYQDKVTGFCIKSDGSYFLVQSKTNPSNYTFITPETNPLISTNKNTFACHTDHNNVEKPIAYRSKQGEKVNLKTYRIAIALTGEFSRTMGTTKEQVVAGLNEHLTRINAVYIRDHAIEFKLISNNDKVIFMDPATDPFQNGNPGALMEKNSSVLTDSIGITNYDIGHVFGTNAGGVALLAVVCKSSKGFGSSSTFGVYEGINYYFIPCHEIGHQLSAEHTFNLCDNSNENSGSAFEPGSGSTIMSYAGASDCGVNYVQNKMDPYFHAHSLNQIKTYSRQGIGRLCGTDIDVSNSSPDIQILSPKNIVIPIGTPFELEGKATDDKNNPLLYAWEQMDLGPKSILGSPIGGAPLFRTFNPVIHPWRIFPSLQNILDGKSSISEILPSTTRPLNFRFTARDFDPKGGATSWADIEFSSTASAGPFTITTLNAIDTLFANDFIQITWNVAQTDKSPVNSKLIDMYWSTDGGVIFQKIVDRTTNDGSEWIQIPAIPTSAARIKLKSSENIFFDINNANLTVLNSPSPVINIAPFPSSLVVCSGQSRTFLIKSSPSNSTDSLILLKDNGLIDFTFNKTKLVANDSVRITFKSDINQANQVIDRKISFYNPSSNDTMTLNINVTVLSGNIKTLSPTYGENQVQSKPNFKWSPLNSSSDFVLEVSDNINFDTIRFFKSIAPGDTNTNLAEELKQNQIYYWRIRPQNTCADTKIPFSLFRTSSLACKVYTPVDLPKFISATGTPRVISTIPINDPINLALISLPTLRGSHDFAGDLTLYLKAPSGDSILLWANECNNLSNFNLTLEDQASIGITCPLTDRKAHRPKQELTKLKSSPSVGIWSLIVLDTKAGSGGSLDEWSIQLCGAITNPSPILSVNKELSILELQTAVINNNTLEYKDTDSPPAELKYTLISNFSLGSLILGADTLKTGSQFTQSDINSGKLRIVAKSVKNDTTESLDFIVQDFQNNWSEIQKLNLRILNDFSIAQKDVEFINLKIYPNPFKQTILIQYNTSERVDITIVELSGKVVKSMKGLSREEPLDLHELLQGIYLIRVKGKNQKQSNWVKIIKID